MRIKLPKFANKTQLFDYLVANKHDLIEQKKSLPIKSEGILCDPLAIEKGGYFDSEELKTLKNFKGDLVAPDDPNIIRVRTVANAFGFIDSHTDVLLRDCAKKTIRDRKGIIPHLHDHIHETTAEVGDVLDVYLGDVPLTKLGYNSTGETQCILMVTDIRKDYNEKIFLRYKTGRAKQHSIGLQYVKLYLCINNENYKEEFSNWEKFYDQVINKDVADYLGYFWAVTEIKLIENSVVLFGSNQYTPTESSVYSEEETDSKSKPLGDNTSEKTKPSGNDTSKKSKKKLESLKEILNLLP